MYSGLFKKTFGFQRLFCQDSKLNGLKHPVFSLQNEKLGNCVVESMASKNAMKLFFSSFLELSVRRDIWVKYHGSYTLLAGCF